MNTVTVTNLDTAVAISEDFGGVPLGNDGGIETDRESDTVEEHVRRSQVHQHDTISDTDPSDH